MKRLHLLLLTLLAVLSFGLAAAVPAVSADNRYFCGKQCDGKRPGWRIPSNGVVCKRSAEVISHGAFYNFANAARGGSDPQMVVHVYYSRVCQTMWARLTNRGSRHFDCQMEIYNREAFYRAACPAAGRSVTTVMVNDHSPTYGKYATFMASEYYHHLGHKIISGYDFRY